MSLRNRQSPIRAYAITPSGIYAFIEMRMESVGDCVILKVRVYQKIMFDNLFI